MSFPRQTLSREPNRPLRQASRNRASGESVPRQLGPWQLVAPLAQGRLCRVYAARGADAPEEQPPPYAVKLLRARWEQDAQKRACLHREAELGSRIQCPHLVPVLADHLERPPFYLVMPRVPGISLRRFLQQGRRVSVAVALGVARQVAQALAALEALGWMHGDVKPANVMLSPSGHVTLLDLGYARRLDEEAWQLERPLVGTPYYMAPEMFTSRLKVDIRADLYSLGALLYELITGVRPFAGPQLSQVVTQHLTQAPRPVRHLVPWLPRPVAELVHRLLAKDPLRRPDNAAELVQELVHLEVRFFDHREVLR